MISRDAALAAVRSHFTPTAIGQNPSRVLTERARRDANYLTVLTDAVSDLDAAYALGMFHWFRCLALPEGADQDDFTAAAQFLTPVFRVDPAAVPEPLRGLCQETHNQGGDEAGAATDRAIGLVATYKRAGGRNLLEAITLLHATAAATPPGHPDRAGHLFNLGIAQQMLGERTEDTATQEQAVRAIREAVAAAPADHPDRATYLNNLGFALQVLGESTEDTSILEEAAQAGRDAVAAAPADHPDRATYLNNLGFALQVLGESTEDTSILEEAAQAGRDAVAAAPAGHPDRATYLNNLVTALLTLSARTEDTAVLEEAAQAGRDAVAAAPAATQTAPHT